MLTRREQDALIALAAWARRYAYAPYSKFAVGAAVVAEDDRTFYGSNVENASLGLTLCAERAAMAAAAGAGVRLLRGLVIVTETAEPTMPCGACLQWLAEFGSPSTLVVAATVGGKTRRAELKDLLKEPFSL